MSDWKCTVLSRDNRHARTFQSVYFVQAASMDGARSKARLRWLDDWEREGEAVSWLSCKTEILTEPQVIFW